MQVPTFSMTTAQRTAKVAAAGFGVVAIFQLLLALGAPWGEAALGGYNEETLPSELRVVSLVSMAVFLGAGFVVLGRAGHWGDRLSGAFRVETCALAVILPLGAQNVVNRHYKPLLKRAGLPSIRWHDLRHTYATLLLGRGTNPTYVQKSLGHASVQLTLDRYSHWMPSMGRNVADGIDEALG